MIRPLRIKNTSGMFCDIITHRNEKIASNIKLRRDAFDKLISYPITSFGYDLTDFKLYSIGGVEKNPRFSKHDIIRALDFWIEHWVYQNQVESVLTGTVNVDHEITLKELILVREKIMKMAVETQFTRGRIRAEPEDGRNFNFEKNGRYYRYSNGKIDTNMTGDERFLFNKKLGIEFPRPKKIELPEKIVFTEAVIGDGSASTVTDPFCHKVIEITREEYNKKSKPYAIGTVELTLAGLARDTNNFSRIMSETFARAISQAEVPTATVRGLDDVISSSTGPDHLFTSGLHPGIPVITYENMHAGIGDSGINAGENSFITVPVRFSGNGTEISMDIIMVSSIGMIDQITSWIGHRIQIRPDSIQDNFLEIDGQQYHTTNVSISHNPRTPLPSMHFRDLWIESIEATVSSTGTTLRIDFQTTMGLTRTTISLTLHNPDILLSNNSALMRQSINNDQQRTWDLEILGNERVRIGGDIFVVLEPIRIDMR